MILVLLASLNLPKSYTRCESFLKKPPPLARAVPDMIVHVAIQFLAKLPGNKFDWLSILVARFTTTIPFMDNSLPRFSYDFGLPVNCLSDWPLQEMYDICVFRQCPSVYSIQLLSSPWLCFAFLYIVRHCGMTEGFIISIMYNWHHDLYTCQDKISWEVCH